MRVLWLLVVAPLVSSPLGSEEVSWCTKQANTMQPFISDQLKGFQNCVVHKPSLTKLDQFSENLRTATPSLPLIVVKNVSNFRLRVDILKKYDIGKIQTPICTKIWNNIFSISLPPPSTWRFSEKASTFVSGDFPKNSNQDI